METEYAECPGYKSKTYYRVVIETQKHLGWRCVFAGDGAMKFQHENGDKLDFYHGRKDDWMARCWADFLAMAERHNA